MSKLVCTLLLIFSSHLFAGNVRPFWTETSSYIEGDYLYVVGIATKVPTVEKGRKLAFDNGKNEIMNFSQLSNIDGMKIETQMTYEEPNAGSHNVYRLMFVNYEKLNSLISKNIEKTKQNYQKHQKKQEEEIKIKTVALSKIKKNSAELAKLDNGFNKIVKNVESLSEKAFRYVKVDMTMSEVITLLGQPRATYNNSSTYKSATKIAHNYGKYWVVYPVKLNMVKCLSTGKYCVTSNCNADKSVCESYGTKSYSYKMIE